MMDVVKFSHTTVIQVAATLERHLRNRPDLRVSASGQAWWGAALRHASAALAAARRAVVSGESVECEDPPAPPEPEAAAPWWRRLAWLPRNLWRALYLADLRQRETVLEEARSFHRWLDQLLALEGAVQGVVSDDFARVEAAVERAATALREHTGAKLDVVPTRMLLPVAGGTWRVPGWRSLRLLWPRETVRGERLVRMLVDQVAAFHNITMRELIDQIAELLDETERDLRTMRNVLRGAYGEADDEAEHEAAYAERAKRRIDEFVSDAAALRKSARATIGKSITAVFTAFADLRTHTAWRIQRNLAVLGIGRMRRRLDAAESRWQEFSERVAERFDRLVSETIKPALGLAHPTRISMRRRRIDPAWIRPPTVPTEFAEIVLDRNNPRLIITPAPLLKSIKEMRANFDAGERGTLLLLTDNLGGAFGMLGQALSLYFRDVPYRLLRQQVTRPLEALPQIDEPLLFVDNLERMVLLDAEHIAQTVALVDSLATHPALVVLSVQQAAAKVLKLAAPTLANVTIELNIAKFDRESFEAVMRRRMAASGYRFEFDDEGEFWAALYTAASGIPGVGLRLLLRCVENVSDNTLKLRYALPPLDDFLNGLELEGLLLLRRLNMQPYFPVSALPPAQRARLPGLVQTGLLHIAGERAAIAPQFYGVLRDHLLRHNLV